MTTMHVNFSSGQASRALPVMGITSNPFKRYVDLWENNSAKLRDKVGDALGDALQDAVISARQHARTAWGDELAEEIEYWSHAGEVHVGVRGEDAFEAMSREFGSMNHRPAPVLRVATMGNPALSRTFNERLNYLLGIMT